MKACILLLTLFLNLTLSASSDEIQIIEARIRKLQDTAKIFYAENEFNKYQLELIKPIIKKQTLIGFDFIEKKKFTFSLTEKEVKYILSNLDILSNQTWDNNLFDNSYKIPNDSIGYYIKAFNFDYWKPKSGNQVWWFSKPIFIRDNSYCLFFSQYICGTLCGHDEWCLYKKIDGVWEKWIILTSGDF